jgi:Cu+-exporting ATPase
VTEATINKNGSLVIESSKVGADTVLAQIVEMVSNAKRSRAPIQGLADRVSAIFGQPWSGCQSLPSPYG